MYIIVKEKCSQTLQMGRNDEIVKSIQTLSFYNKQVPSIIKYIYISV